MRRIPSASLLLVALPLAASAQTPNLIADGGNSAGYDMAPETRLSVVEAAAATLPPDPTRGPFAPTWDSLRQHYRVPAWFYGAKFGIFLHWGVYAVPAHHNEWYEKQMYASDHAWHEAHFGPVDTFGYKDFIPRFTCERFDPAAWAELFAKAGARFVIPTAQHHDNFALWDSQVTPYNAKRMGPHRDLIGELAQAVRARGLKFGVSNHEMESFQFVNPMPALAAKLAAEHADLYDPKWELFYHVADRSDAACQAFLVDWYRRNVELIDRYQPDILWFDNGIDQRYLDPLKLRVAAYYYNRAAQWGKDVTISAKKAAFAPSGRNRQTIGSVIDFEKIGTRSPAGIRTGAWEVDQPIGNTWGYTDGMRIASSRSLIEGLVDTVSKNGTFLLNLSPRADGTIPKEQQAALLAMGHWLAVNGEAIYGTHHWKAFGAGRSIRFTAKEDALYAIVFPDAVLSSEVTLPLSDGPVTRVDELGGSNGLKFRQSATALQVTLPAASSGHDAIVLKITGLKIPSPSDPEDGNPQ